MNQIWMNEVIKQKLINMYTLAFFLDKEYNTLIISNLQFLSYLPPTQTLQDFWHRLNTKGNLLHWALVACRPHFEDISVTAPDAIFKLDLSQSI